MSKQLVEMVTVLEDLHTQKNNKEKDVAELNRRIQDQSSKISQEIRAGATTGDWVRDLVLRVHGLNPELEAKYRPLNEALKGKKGELILIAFECVVGSIFRSDRIYPEFKRLVKLFRLGILHDEKLVCEGNSTFLLSGVSGIILPASQYIELVVTPVLLEGDINPKALSVEKKNIFSTNHMKWEANPPYLEEMLGGDWEKKILIGEKGIRERFEEERMEKLYPAAAEKLGYFVLTSPALEPTE